MWVNAEMDRGARTYDAQVERLKARLVQLRGGEVLSLDARYVRGILLKCSSPDCMTVETFPGQFHIRFNNGPNRFCSRACLVYFEEYLHRTDFTAMLDNKLLLHIFKNLPQVWRAEGRGG